MSEPPPAKRMRLLPALRQSLEVDETNPDYIAAKEKQRAKLESRFASIIAKFEAMPESMSDEVDMRTGTIVVDRGHLRKMNEKYTQKRGRNAGQLLDHLVGDDFDSASGEEDASEDVRDELAPSQTPEPVKRTPTAASGVHNTASSESARSEASLPFTPSTGAPAPPAIAQNALASTDWAQALSFPNTPAGQAAQNAFMAQISQAVQQAITPIISSMLTSAPGLREHDARSSLERTAMPDVSSNGLETTPSSVRGLPTLRLPAIPPPRLRTAVHRLSDRRARVGDNSSVRKSSNNAEGASHSIYAADTATEKPSGRQPSKKPSTTRRSMHKVLVKTDELLAHHAAAKGARAVPKTVAAHLPTPSSLSQDDSRAPDHGFECVSSPYSSKALAAADPFDEDDRDLLSLDGHALQSEVEALPEAFPERGVEDYEESSEKARDEDDDFGPAGSVVASIETDDLEDSIMQDDTRHLPSSSLHTSRNKSTSLSKRDLVYPASSPRKPTSKSKRISFRLGSDSDLEPASDIDFADELSSRNQRAHKAVRPRKRPATVEKSKAKRRRVVDEDEHMSAATITTPRIKRESHTPPHVFMSATPKRTFQTPKSAPQRSVAASSDDPASSDPQLAREAFLKRVKQSWAKGGRKGWMQRVSLGAATPSRRMWSDADVDHDGAVVDAGEADSEDELAV